MNAYSRCWCYGFFFGTFAATLMCIASANTIAKPSVESYPEFRQLAADHWKTESERDRLQRDLDITRIDLDTLRRSVREPFNPKGKDVSPEDRIPVPAVPLPTVPAPVPVAPNEKDDVSNDQPQPVPQEEGEEVGMAATPTKTTAMAKSLPINSVEDLYRVAEILYRGGASQLPNVGSPNHVFHLILHGMEIGLSYAQSLAGLSMGKNGKPSIMGDAALALVFQSGLLEDIKEFIEGGDDPQKGVCIVKRKGFPEPRRFEFTIQQAEQAGLIKRAKNEKGDGPWLAYRFRMLRYRPLGYALRDVFPDVLKGLHLTEELQDAEVVTEVKVLGTTADAPAASLALALPAASANPVINERVKGPALPVVDLTGSAISPSQLATAPATGSPPQPQPYIITQVQANEIRRLKNLAMASKAISEPTAQKAEWEQILAPYGVSSVAQMTEEGINKLISDLAAKHDPFSNPDSARGASA